MVNKPAVAGGSATYDSGSLGDDFVAVNHGCEVVAVIASAGGGSIAVRLYDGTATPGNNKLFIAANAGESTPFTPAQPIKFANQVRVVFEQGGQAQGGGEVTLVIN